MKARGRGDDIVLVESRRQADNIILMKARGRVSSVIQANLSISGGSFGVKASLLTSGRSLPCCLMKEPPER